MCLVYVFCVRGVCPKPGGVPAVIIFDWEATSKLPARSARYMKEAQ